jgi:cytochrome c oxidase subunit 1
MILPAMGVISEVIACFSHKRVYGYEFVAFSSLAIAVISFVVWGHHMFVTGQSVYAGLIFSILSFLVAVPSAIKVFNWTATLYKGSIDLKTPMLYAMGFIGLFTIGGLTGLFLACLSVDIHVTDTYFIIAHFLLHHGRRNGDGVPGRRAFLVAEDHWADVSEWWGRLSALLVFIGFKPHVFPAVHGRLLGHCRVAIMRMLRNIRFTT